MYKILERVDFPISRRRIDKKIYIDRLEKMVFWCPPADERAEREELLWERLSQRGVIHSTTGHIVSVWCIRARAASIQGGASTRKKKITTKSIRIQIERLLYIITGTTPNFQKERTSHGEPSHNRGMLRFKWGNILAGYWSDFFFQLNNISKGDIH